MKQPNRDLLLYDDEGDIEYASNISFEEITSVLYDYNLNESQIKTKNGRTYVCNGDFVKYANDTGYTGFNLWEDNFDETAETDV